MDERSGAEAGEGGDMGRGGDGDFSIVEAESVTTVC